jgi:hypothetical protein
VVVVFRTGLDPVLPSSATEDAGCSSSPVASATGAVAAEAIRPTPSSELVATVLRVSRRVREGGMAVSIGLPPTIGGSRAERAGKPRRRRRAGRDTRS